MDPYAGLCSSGALLFLLFRDYHSTLSRRASSFLRDCPDFHPKGILFFLGGAPQPSPAGQPKPTCRRGCFKGGGRGSVAGQYLWVGDQILKKPGKWGYAIGATARPMRTQPEHTPNCVTSRHGSRCRAPIPGKGRAELFIQAVLSAASPHQGGRWAILNIS